MRIRSEDDDDSFSVYVPPEVRFENRVKLEHTNKEWKLKKDEYNHRCAYCGIREQDTKQGYLTRDHVYPVHFGGRDTIGNIVPACETCNKRKRHNFVGSLDKRGHCIPNPKPRTRVESW